jgi:hypothetical protein
VKNYTIGQITSSCGVLIHPEWDRDRSRDLGVIMDDKMTFSEHVNVLVAKAFAMLGFIRTFVRV